MKLIVGLGNPGKKYEKIRHNIGWRVIDELAKALETSNWKLERRCQAQVSKNKDLILAKPTTFMNNSGAAVKSLITNYSITRLLNLWLIHDDIDLPLGKIKIVKGRGAAGHRGVLSVIERLGTVDFIRFRLGIGHPHAGRRMEGGKRATKFDTQEEMEDFVLAPFLATEIGRARKLVKKTIRVVELALKDGIEIAMNRYN